MNEQILMVSTDSFIEAFVIRTMGGNVRPYLNDLLYLEALLNNELRDIIIIHHEGTQRLFVIHQMSSNRIRLWDYPNIRGDDQKQYQGPNLKP